MKNHSRIALPSYTRHLGLSLTRGIEKESLRVDPSGHLAQTPHPKRLGSALMHPAITTDFSESLMEFITHPHVHPNDVLKELDTIHRWVVQQIGDEHLWCASMPCILSGAPDIPIAQYGQSHWGQMKEIYREGLASRYGKNMQMIAGIHFNVSFSDTLFLAIPHEATGATALQALKNQRYFELIRTFLKQGWIIPYLFGASPALCTTFLDGHRQKQANRLPLVSWDQYTQYLPHGTSLRLSPLGYRSDVQNQVPVSNADLQTYLKTLRQALNTPYPDYAAFSKQLSPNLLQIENEYYAPIRPKNRARKQESPSDALRIRGVQYVEMRTLDLDPFSPLGISLETMLFMEIFAAYCFFNPSPPLTETEQHRLQERFDTVVLRGREPGLVLEDDSGQKQRLKDLGLSLLEQLTPIALLLEEQYPDVAYLSALELQIQKFENPDLTPSAQILHEMSTPVQQSFHRFTETQSLKHCTGLKANPLPLEQMIHFESIAEQSFAAQAQLEQTDRDSGICFETFLKQYFAGRGT